MNFLSDWISFFVALLGTAVEWLASMQIMSVPVLGIIAAAFILGVVLRSMLYKP